MESLDNAISQSLALKALTQHENYDEKLRGKLVSDDFSKQLTNSSDDARRHWTLVEHYRTRQNDLATAIALLEHAREQKLHEDPLYLDLLQKLDWELSQGAVRPATCDLKPRVDHLMNRAPTSPSFPKQRARFYECLSEDAKRMVEVMSVKQACAFLQRGYLRQSANQAASIRSRIWEVLSTTGGYDDYASRQRLFARLRNCQFMSIYESMSKRELEEELRARSVSIGRKDAGYTVDSLRQKLANSDLVFCDNALIDDYGNLFQEQEMSLGLFNVDAGQKQSLSSAIFDIMHTLDAKTRGRKFHELQNRFGRLDDLPKRRFWIFVDLSNTTRIGAKWRLRFEHLFKPADAYEISELRALATKLKLKTRRHATKADWLQAVKLFLHCRQKMIESTTEKEDEYTDEVFHKRCSWLPTLRAKYDCMSLGRLEQEFEMRRLAQNVVDQGSLKRCPRIHGVPGSRALQLRACLRRSDEAFLEHCPDAGYLGQPVKILRPLVSAMGIEQGDQTLSTMFENLNAFRRQQMDTYFESSMQGADDDHCVDEVAMPPSKKFKRR